jgi:Domain of unknown function (DUF4407)
MKKLLEFLSGADPDILSRSECAGERRIYQAIGLSVLITGILAGCSGGYAIYSIFKSAKIAIIFGICWGSAIAATDRFLIMTTQKKNSFCWKQVCIATGRILLASLIAIVISKPLEMAIFSKEINANIASANLAAEVQMQKTVALLPESLEIERLRLENKNLNAADAQSAADYQKVYQSVVGEAEGTSGSLKAGKGIAFNEKSQEMARQKSLLEATTSQHRTKITENEGQIKTLDKAKANKVTQVRTARLNSDSILAQMQMLHKMAASDSTVKWSSFLITAIFVAFDVLPILGKLLMPRTAYDAIQHYLTSATIKRQEALVANLEREISQEMDRYNSVQSKIGELSTQALVDAAIAAQGSRRWRRSVAKAAHSLAKRTSDELMAAIDSVRFPKSTFANAARKAVEEEIPDIARDQARNRIYRNKVTNAANDIADEAERAVNGFVNKKDRNG